MLCVVSAWKGSNSKGYWSFQKNSLIHLLWHNTVLVLVLWKGFYSLSHATFASKHILNDEERKERERQKSISENWSKSGEEYMLERKPCVCRLMTGIRKWCIRREKGRGAKKKLAMCENDSRGCKENGWHLGWRKCIGNFDTFQWVVIFNENTIISSKQHF